MDPAVPLHPRRRIAHLDMDAFFASVELLRYPQLRGLPLVIGGGRRAFDAALAQWDQPLPPHEIPLEAFPKILDYVGRGVISTATYEARQYGVGSAMGLMKAAKLCPHAIRLPSDFDQYRHFSHLFKSTVREIAPLVEDRGIDEIYIDFTEVPGGQREGGRVLARLLQKSVLQATGLTCSIGVAPNKLLAKMASEFNKPNGISVIFETDLQTRIWPLACRKIHGIGPKAELRLAGHGIHTIGELAARAPDWLREHFGKSHAPWLLEASWGRDERPLVTESEPVSISRETTFERDLHAVRDRSELGTILTQLCEQLGADLQRKGYRGKTIGIKLRYDDFRIVTRDQTIELAICEGKVIRQVAGQCLKRVDLTRRLRLLGVRVGSLQAIGADGATDAASTVRRSADTALQEPDLFS